MRFLFYLGFFIINFTMMNILLNIQEAKWLQQYDISKINEHYTTIHSFLWALGITLVYFGVFEW